MNRQVLRVVEAAYAPAATETEWLRGITEAAHPALDSQFGVLAYSFNLPRRGRPSMRVGAATEADAYVMSLQAIHTDTRSPVALHRRVTSLNAVLSLSEFFGAKPNEQPYIGDHHGPIGIQDQLGIVALNPSGNGLVVAAAWAHVHTVSPAFRRKWELVLSHLAAGARLREASGSPAADEAVLDPSGKVLDAFGPARSKAARTALREAARTIDRARSLRSDPEHALKSWRALVDGRWSLVDHFDSDGRHFVIARRNPGLGAPPVPEKDPRRELSESERVVTGLAALGRSNKLIAYDLGVAVGTVATHLARAARKWNVNSRARLIFEWQRRQALALDAAE